MQRTVYYAMFETPELKRLAEQFGVQRYWDGGEICSTHEHDRIGRDLSRAQFEQAAWMIFMGSFDLAKMDGAREFLKECMKLGFAGCWEVRELRGGESDVELLARAREYESDALKNILEVKQL